MFDGMALAGTIREPGPIAGDVGEIGDVGDRGIDGDNGAGLIDS